MSRERQQQGQYHEELEEDASFTPAGILARQAVGLGDSRTLRRLLELSIDGRKETSTVVHARRGWRVCLLHLAAFEGSVDTTLLLLAAGAAVNAQDLDGWTPLHYAARNEFQAETLVRTLVAAGADIDKPDNRGRTALHVAYLCGNFGAAHELLQQGASASARDLHHRTPMQMLQQHRTARSRPLSGSAATTSHGRSGSGHKAAVTSPSVSARRDRPFADSPTDGLPHDILSRRESLTAARSVKFVCYDEAAGSLSTVSQEGREGASPPGSSFSLDLAAGSRQEPPVTLRAPTCPNTAVIHSPAEDNSSPALAAPVHLGDEGFPLGQKGVYDFESVYPDGSQEATTVVVEATPTSKCCKCGRAIASTGCKEFDSNDNNRPATRKAPAATLPTVITQEDSETQVLEGNAQTEVSLSEDLALPSRTYVMSVTPKIRSRSLSGSKISRQTSTILPAWQRGRCEHRSRSAGRARAQSASNWGGRGRHHRLFLRSIESSRIRQPESKGRGKTRRSSARSGGTQGVVCRRNILKPGDEVPDYVAGQRRWIWAKISAASAAEREAQNSQRREACRSPLRIKMETLAASNVSEKERQRNRAGRKPEYPRPPGGREGRDDSGKLAGRPSSSPAALSPPTIFTAAPLAPFGGRLCIKCDYSGRWDITGAFLGGWGDSVGGNVDVGGVACWHRTVTESYRIAQLWRKSHTDGSEFWWAKQRTSQAGSTVVVKSPGENGESWVSFTREWGTLKYLQEEGWRDGRGPLSVGLIAAFEKERSLVLSVPAATRTLREIGQRMHAKRKTRGGQAAEDMFCAKVTSLAIQALRAVCWLHHCGLICGDITPDNFVSPGGGTFVGRSSHICGGSLSKEKTHQRGGSYRSEEVARGDIRLLSFRSVTRRPDDAGGCPKHPLLQLVGPEFPSGQPFDLVYAAPERVAAASKGEACPASPAVDAWGLGMTLYWLLSGRDYARDDTGGEVLSESSTDGKNMATDMKAGRERGGLADDDVGVNKLAHNENLQGANFMPAGEVTIFSIVPGLLSRDPATRTKVLVAAGRKATRSAGIAGATRSPIITRAPVSSALAHQYHSSSYRCARSGSAAPRRLFGSDTSLATPTPTTPGSYETAAAGNQTALRRSANDGDGLAKPSVGGGGQAAIQKSPEKTRSRCMREMSSGEQNARTDSTGSQTSAERENRGTPLAALAVASMALVPEEAAGCPVLLSISFLSMEQDARKGTLDNGCEIAATSPQICAPEENDGVVHEVGTASRGDAAHAKVRGVVRVVGNQCARAEEGGVKKTSMQPQRQTGIATQPSPAPIPSPAGNAVAKVVKLCFVRRSDLSRSIGVEMLFPELEFHALQASLNPALLIRVNGEQWPGGMEVDSKASSTSPRRSPTLVSQRKTQPNSDEVDTTKKLTHIPVGNSPRSCPERLALYLQAVVQVVSEREGVSVVGGGERSSSLITSLQLYLDEVVPGWDNINMSGENSHTSDAREDVKQYHNTDAKGGNRSPATSPGKGRRTFAGTLGALVMLRKPPPPSARHTTAAKISTSDTVSSAAVAIRGNDEQERTESDSNSEKDGKDSAHEPNTASDGGLEMMNIVAKPAGQIPGFNFSPSGDTFGDMERRCSTKTTAASPAEKETGSQGSDPAGDASVPDPTDGRQATLDMNSPMYDSRKPARHKEGSPVHARRDSNDTCSTATDTYDSDRQNDEDDGVGRRKGEVEKAQTEDVIDDHGEVRAVAGDSTVVGCFIDENKNDRVLELARYAISHGMKVIRSRNKVGVESGSDAVSCSTASGQGDSVDGSQWVRGTPERSRRIVDGSFDRKRSGHILQLARHATRSAKRQMMRRQKVEVAPGISLVNGNDDDVLDSARHAVNEGKGEVEAGGNVGVESSTDAGSPQQRIERREFWSGVCACTVM